MGWMNFFNKDNYEREMGDTIIVSPYYNIPDLEHRPIKKREFKSRQEYESYKNQQRENQIKQEQNKRNKYLESL